VPPGSAFDDLSDTHIVIASTYKKFEVIGALFWLNITVLLVQTTVKFLHHLNIE
jgi:hypothetical protein